MKGRLARVERLQKAMDAVAQHGLTPAEVASLIDTCVNLTGDDNFHAVQGGLHALSVGDHFKIHINVLVPVAVERLGDGSSSSSLNCISPLQETAKFTRAKTLVDKDQALVDSLSMRVCPYLRGF
jgi:hypothetical protein